ncbi:hypothetical protein AAG570_001156 [Ranatra chinensis]|uniref:Uncharacterized protein n=1 Tax=Ranatra chinensis TaxID=642074 RepID=A0ABD0YB24_9HEMI
MNRNINRNRTRLFRRLLLVILVEHVSVLGRHLQRRVNASKSPIHVQLTCFGAFTPICDYPLKLKIASMRRSTFYENKYQETTEIEGSCSPTTSDRQGPHSPLTVTRQTTSQLATVSSNVTYGPVLRSNETTNTSTAFRKSSPVTPPEECGALRCTRERPPRRVHPPYRDVMVSQDLVFLSALLLLAGLTTADDATPSKSTPGHDCNMSIRMRLMLCHPNSTTENGVRPEEVWINILRARDAYNIR